MHVALAHVNRVQDLAYAARRRMMGGKGSLQSRRNAKIGEGVDVAEE